MDSPYRNSLKAAIHAVKIAASIAQAVQTATLKSSSSSSSSPSSSSKYESIIKDDLSPVTVADFAIQTVLTKLLLSAFPDDSFVGEESAAELRADPKLLACVHGVISASDSEGAQMMTPEEDVCTLIDLCGNGTPGDYDSGRVWIFDPIDGTKAFLRGEQYAINLALLEGGRQVLSVVGLPLLSPHLNPSRDTVVTDTSVDPSGEGCIVFAVRGYGAYSRPLFTPSQNDEEMIVPKRLPRHADAVQVDKLRNVTCWNHLDSGIDTAHQAVAANLGMAETFPGCDLLGWVPRWAVLALGHANMTVWVYKTRERHGKIWDHAGAMLLFEEVGGQITDIDGREIDLTAGRTLKGNCGFVAAPRSVHHVVLKAVRDTLRQQGKGGLLLR
ncbi:hypothetical protein B0H63DRAFT_392439 [Podospora didyma]|uniref:3'(2'),5'-bisphosphate nucleotidase n=1 Tax=Podospora didyma TaxID=330526 RepID=A0AAE0NUC8_9PEZI|nr:hypothetical protein B0H63DRAFT_392439 [Podospora didyma]